MSTDRELLELAAKAAGYHIHVWGTPGAENVARMDEPGRPRWNPLTEDGDALRLAVKLLVEIYHADDGELAAYASYPNERGFAYAIEPHGNDSRAATRRAIVRAAAEIGRGMP